MKNEANEMNTYATHATNEDYGAVFGVFGRYWISFGFVDGAFGPTCIPGSPDTIIIFSACHLPSDSQI